VPLSNFLKTGTLIGTDVGVAGAVVAFGLIVLLADGVVALFAPQREAQAVVEPRAPDDRLTVFAQGAACSLRAWPNYAPPCVFDWREPDRDTGVIAFDRQ
jgi:hypothetical protein